MGTAWEQQRKADWNSMVSGAVNTVAAPSKVPAAAAAENITAPKTTGDTGPIAPDLADEALKKARTNMALRLQFMRGRNSTFSSNQMGSLDMSRSVLGGG